MGQVLLFSALVGVSLAIGALAGLYGRPSQRVEGVLLALASGSLMSAVAFELIETPMANAGVLLVGIALFAGAGVFLLADELLERGGEAGGVVLLVGFVMDGVPETLALGTHPQAALLVAIIVANFPEALGGAAEMREEGHRIRTIAVIWIAASLLIALSGPVGLGISEVAGGSPLSFIRAFAGGAVLATLFTTLVPRAFNDSGPLAAFATVAGFLLSTALTG